MRFTGRLQIDELKEEENNKRRKQETNSSQFSDDLNISENNSKEEKVEFGKEYENYKISFDQLLYKEKLDRKKTIEEHSQKWEIHNFLCGKKEKKLVIQNISTEITKNKLDNKILLFNDTHAHHLFNDLHSHQKIEESDIANFNTNLDNFKMRNWVDILHPNVRKIEIDEDDALILKILWKQHQIKNNNMKYYWECYHQELERIAKNILEKNGPLGEEDAEPVFVRADDCSFKRASVDGDTPNLYVDYLSILEDGLKCEEGHSPFNESVDKGLTLYVLPQKTIVEEFRVFVYEGNITTIGQQHLYTPHPRLGDFSKQDKKIEAINKKLLEKIEELHIETTKLISEIKNNTESDSLKTEIDNDFQVQRVEYCEEADKEREKVKAAFSEIRKEEIKAQIHDWVEKIHKAYDTQIRDKIKIKDHILQNFKLDVAITEEGEVYFMEVDPFPAFSATGAGCFHSVFDWKKLRGYSGDTVTFRYCTGAPNTDSFF